MAVIFILMLGDILVFLGQILAFLGLGGFLLWEKNKRDKNTVYGNCPYCGASIRVWAEGYDCPVCKRRGISRNGKLHRLEDFIADHSNTKLQSDNLKLNENSTDNFRLQSNTITTSNALPIKNATRLKTTILFIIILLIIFIAFILVNNNHNTSI